MDDTQLMEEAEAVRYLQKDPWQVYFTRPGKRRELMGPIHDIRQGCLAKLQRYIKKTVVLGHGIVSDD